MMGLNFYVLGVLKNKQITYCKSVSLALEIMLLDVIIILTSLYDIYGGFHYVRCFVCYPV